MVRDVRLADSPALRLYRAVDAEDQPVLVYLHGGVFIRGDLAAADVLCREVAWRGPCVVVSVDYRLAPEFPFPAALDDVRAAVEWTRADIASYGGDPGRIHLGGDSAGANIVAAQRLPGIRSRILLSGLYDLADDLPTQVEDLDVTVDQARMDWVAGLYAGTASRADPRLSPLRQPDLAGEPPTLLVSSGLDPFVLQNRLYADRLREAGVAVDYVEYPGLPHGFAHLGAFFAETHELYERVARRVADASVGP